MKKGTILILDDNDLFVKSTKLLLEKERELSVFTASNYESAVKKVKYESIDICLLDIRLSSNKSGWDVCTEIRKFDKKVYIIMLTGQDSNASVQLAFEKKADDFINKTHASQNILDAIDRALLNIEFRNRYDYLGKLPKSCLDDIIGESAVIKHIKTQILHYSTTDSNVLIVGETGTGKELVAKALHYCSPRGKHPIISENISALNSNLIESELFGHKKGAFSGAVEDKVGFLKIANNSTLHLDEIGELHPNIQVKLLRVIENKEFRPIGDSNLVGSDFRLITSTHKDLPAEIKNGTFREDFYYRIKTLQIIIPPLRKRLNDIFHLTNHFVYKLNSRYNKKIFVDPSVHKFLRNYNFPGNVRELGMIIENAFIQALTENTLTIKHFQPINETTSTFQVCSTSSVNSDNLKEVFDLNSIITNVILKAQAAFPKKIDASNKLGWSEKKIRNHLKKYPHNESQ